MPCIRTPTVAEFNCYIIVLTISLFARFTLNYCSSSVNPPFPVVRAIDPSGLAHLRMRGLGTGPSCDVTRATSILGKEVASVLRNKVTGTGGSYAGVDRSCIVAKRVPLGNTGTRARRWKFILQWLLRVGLCGHIPEAVPGDC